MRRPGADVIATVIVYSASEPQLEAICDRLVDDRYAPLPGTTATAAARLCRYGRAELLILDVGLPHHAVLRLLRERTEWDDFPDIGVLALMNRGDDPAVLTDDPALAVDDYLKRPFVLDELRHRLETIVRRRQDPARVDLECRDRRLGRRPGLAAEAPSRPVAARTAASTTPAARGGRATV